MKKMLSVILTICIFIGLMSTFSVYAAEENLIFKEGVTAEATSNQYATYPPEHTFDGKLSTYWSSKGESNQHIIFKLNKVSTINRVVAWLTANMGSNNASRLFQYSIDGENWSSEYVSSPFTSLINLSLAATPESERTYYDAQGEPTVTATGYKRTYSFTSDTIVAQYIKIGNIDSSAHLQIREIEIFGEEYSAPEGLSELSVDGYELSPQFNEYEYEYSITVGIDDVIPDTSEISAVAVNENAEVDIIQATETEPYVITVTPPDEGEPVVYTINVKRVQAYDYYNLLNFINDKENKEDYFDGQKLINGQRSNAINGNLETYWQLQTSGGVVGNELPWMSVKLDEPIKVSAASIIMKEAGIGTSAMWYSTAIEPPPFHKEKDSSVINIYHEVDNPDGWIRITAPSVIEEDYIGANSRYETFAFASPVEAQHFAWSFNGQRNIRIHQFGLYNLIEEPYAEFDNDEIPGDAPVKGEFKIRNTTPSTAINVKALFILAVYDGENNLYDIKIINNSETGKVLSIPGKINVLASLQSNKDIPSGYSAKLLMWDGFSTAKPIISFKGMPNE